MVDGGRAVFQEGQQVTLVHEHYFRDVVKPLSSEQGFHLPTGLLDHFVNGVRHGEFAIEIDA